MKKFSPGRWVLCVLSTFAVLYLTFGGQHAIVHVPGVGDVTPVIGFAAILPATALQAVNLMTEQAWAVNQRQIDMSTVDAATFSKLLAAQKALGAPFMQKLTDPTKEWGDIKIFWQDFCGQEAEDCEESGADLCGDLSGDESEVESQPYQIESCINTKFSVSENTFAGSWADLKQFLINEQNQQIIKIVNKLNEKAIVFLHANAGVNLGNQYTLNGGNQAEVPEAEFEDTKLITKMMLDAEISNVRNPFMITGDPAMFITWTDAKFDAGNFDGKGDQARSSMFDPTLDVRGFIKVPTLAGSTFLVTPYAYAFATKNYYPNSAPIYDNDLGKWKYSIRVPAYGIVIDVLHQRVCEDAAKDRWKHYFNYRLHYDFLPNPNGCLDEASGKRVSGILEYLNTGANISS